MEPNEIPQILEAILFVAGEPVAVADLAQALEVSELEIMHAVEELQRECERRGVTIHRYGDHLRMETRRNTRPMWNACFSPCSARPFRRLPWKRWLSSPTASPSPRARWSRCAGQVRLFRSVASAQGAHPGGRAQGGAGPAHPVRYHGPFSGTFRHLRYP